MDIRIRAWDAKRGKMMEGDFIEDCHPTYRVSLAYGKLTIYDTTGGNLEELPTMLSTGLYDKNGKGVYECDVVQWLGYEVQAGRQIRPPRVIIVGQGYFPPHEDTWHGIDYITDCYHLQNLIAHGDKSVEILGNIYEHSHLLK